MTAVNMVILTSAGRKLSVGVLNDVLGEVTRVYLTPKECRMVAKDLLAHADRMDANDHTSSSDNDA